MSSFGVSKHALRSRLSSLQGIAIAPLGYKYPSVWFRNTSSKRWQARQSRDRLTLQAKVQGLKSRAAFKLLEINDKHRLFRPGQVVVDLGYAPGSWSQIAVDRTRPGGRVVGIDVIPAQPPKGVSTIQGNFLSQNVQEQAKKLIRDLGQDVSGLSKRDALVYGFEAQPGSEVDLGNEDREQRAFMRSSLDSPCQDSAEMRVGLHNLDKDIGHHKERMVDVILSDMSEPWTQTEGFWKRRLSDPYYRMMNTSGMSFRDHAGSMDLCQAAVEFARDILKDGGHLVCKFYQGLEDKQLENCLRKLFTKVYREKPESSRTESKEAYFVALKRKSNRESLKRDC